MSDKNADGQAGQIPCTAPSQEGHAAGPACSAPDEAPKDVMLNIAHPRCHDAANAFWQYWKENGETHRHGYYESTWGAINSALRVVGVVAPLDEALVKRVLETAEHCASIQMKPIADLLAECAAALTAQGGEQSAETVIVQAAWWVKIKEALGRRFPRCRGCADDGPICPDSGLPCRLDDMRGGAQEGEMTAPLTPRTKGPCCRLCGAGVSQCKGYLQRVNPKGGAGIWECRPICGADLPPDERFIYAIEGDKND